MAARLKVGELVSYGEAPADEVAGLVVEIRRSDCRVLNLDAEQSYWLPRSNLRRGARTIRKGSITSLLSSLVRHVEGTEIEIDHAPDGGLRVQIACPGVDADGVGQIRRFFGPAYRSLRIAPGGLGKIYLVLELAPFGEKLPSR